MIRGYGKRYRLDSTIIQNFNLTLYKAFTEAYDRGQGSSWRRISDYTFEQLFKAIGRRSFSMMDMLFHLPLSYYLKVAGNKEAKKYVIENTALNFKSITWFFKPDRRAKKEIDTQLVLLFYSYATGFYHYLLTEPELDLLEYALNEYNQFIDQDYDMDTRFAIEQMVRANTPDGEVEAVRLAADKNWFVEITHRRATLALLSWTLYLYSFDQIKEERLIFLLNKIQLHYQFFEDLLADIIFIRKSETSHYLDLDGWDDTERPNGVVSYPPMLSDWIIWGLTYFAIKGNPPHFMLSVTLNDRDVEFLPEALEKVIKELSDHLFKWERIIGLASDKNQNEDERKVALAEQFEERIRPVRNIFQQLRQRYQASKALEMVEEPISEELVATFKKRLADAWQKQAAIYTLFDHYGNVNRLENDEGLLDYGANYFLREFRQMFIERNFQEIYGSSDLGSNAGRMTDRAFVNFAVNAKPEIPVADNLLQSLDDQIESLQEAGYEPTIIIIPPEFSYKTHLMDSPNFEHKVDPNDISDFGRYKSIPVTTFYSRNLINQVMVADFVQAFDLEIYENDQLYHRRLKIELKELTPEEVDQQYNEDPDSWRTNQQGINFNEQEAKRRVALSMNLKILSKARFTLKDVQALSLQIINLPDLS